MRQHLLITAEAFLILTGCDKSTEPNIVETGRAATQSATETVAIMNGQTLDVSALSRKISDAEELIDAGQIATARSLLDQVEPRKDLLSAADQARYEEARRKVAH